MVWYKLNRELGIKNVLIVCYRDNLASAKTILKNGGKLENERLAGRKNRLKVLDFIIVKWRRYKIRNDINWNKEGK